MSENQAIALVMIGLGLVIVVLAKPIARLFVGMQEFWLEVVRRSWFPWYFRAFGGLFVALGTISFTFSAS